MKKNLLVLTLFFLSSTPAFSAPFGEELFHQLIDRFENIYRETIKQKGFEFSTIRHWEQDIVSASADRKDHQWLIYVYGGVPRHPDITPDGFLLLLCHELGHLMGGLPRNSRIDWAATIEGQADYFASLKCLRKIFEKDQNEEIISQLNVPEIVTTQCSLAHRTPQDVAICIRSSMAGKALANVWATGKYRQPQFHTPSQDNRYFHMEKHPDTQCRLDTYFQGALCPVPADEEISDEDIFQGTCHPKFGHTIGVRPVCWMGTLHWSIQ